MAIKKMKRGDYQVDGFSYDKGKTMEAGGRHLPDMHSYGYPFAMNNTGNAIMSTFEVGGRHLPNLHGYGYPFVMSNVGNPVMSTFQQGGPIPWQNGYNGGYMQMGGIPDRDGDIDMMKSGGIHIKPSKVGSLHTHLGVPQGQKIPASKLSIKPGDSPAIRKKKQFAINASHWHHEMGGPTDYEPVMMKDGGHWIHTNPANKGDCTPMTKSTCTGHKRAFAETMKKHHGFHQYGGQYDDGGAIPPMQPSMPQPLPTPMPAAPGMPGAWTPPTIPQNQIPQAPEPVFNQESFQDDDKKRMYRRPPIGTGLDNILGAGLATAAYFNDRSQQRQMAGYNRELGMTDNAFARVNQPGSKGDYTPNQGYFRPQNSISGNQGMFYPQHEYGGRHLPDLNNYGYPFNMNNTGNAIMSTFEHGGQYHQGMEVELHPEEIARLQKLGYKLQIM